MSTIKTLTRLRDLKLGGMAAALEHQQNQLGTYDELSFTERLELLLDRECQTREHRKQDRLVRQARFKLRGPRFRTLTTSTRAISKKPKWRSWPRPIGWSGDRTC